MTDLGIAELLYEVAGGEVGLGFNFDVVRWVAEREPTQCWGDDCYGWSHRTDSELGLCEECTEGLIAHPL